jgi:predicted transcriptional regulator
MIDFPTVSTVQEIRSAIGRLTAPERALLTAELFATNSEPEADELERALSRGLADVQAGRVRAIEEVKAMIPQWTSKS